MTQPPQLGPYQDSTISFLHLACRDQGNRMLLSEMTELIDRVPHLLSVGYYADLQILSRQRQAMFTDVPDLDRFSNLTFGFNVESVIEAGHDVSGELREQLYVVRLSYASPIDMLLAIPTPWPQIMSVGSVIGALRGSIWLMNQWQRYKVNRASADYQSACYEMLTQEVLEGRRRPSRRDLEQASRLLPQIERIEYQTQASATVEDPDEPEGQDSEV